jgi:hypothetical protein
MFDEGLKVIHPHPTPTHGYAGLFTEGMVRALFQRPRVKSGNFTGILPLA